MKGTVLVRDELTIEAAAYLAAEQLRKSKADAVVVHGEVAQAYIDSLVLDQDSTRIYAVIAFRDESRMESFEDYLEDDDISGCISSEYGTTLAYVGYPNVFAILEALKNAEA